MWDQILSGIINQATSSINLNNPEVDRYVKWVTGLIQNALVKWKVIGQSGLRCKVRLQSHTGRVIGCEAPAILVCQACNEPVCLAHAFVTSDGSGVCVGCVEVLKQFKKPGGAGSSTGNESPEELKKKYLKVLGVSENATKDEIVSAYRDLVKKYHPDKQRNSSAKKKAHDKMCELNQAYDWLNRNMP